MKLSELTSTHRPTYPEPYTWDDTVNFMLNDPFEKEIVDLLVDTLRRKGKFREPVSLGLGDIEGVENTPVITDGTHRVCAHIIFGSDEVDVRFDEPYTDEELEDGRLPKFTELPIKDEGEESSYIASELFFAAPISDDDEWDLLFTLLRSFPISDDVWVTAGVFSSLESNLDGTTTFNIGWDLENPTREDMLAVHREVKERIKRYPHGGFLKVETIIESYGPDGETVIVAR